MPTAPSQVHQDQLKISAQERLLFTKHLSAMIKAGITMADSLKALEEQYDHGQLAKLVKSISTSVEAGSTISQAFAYHPHSFSHFYIGMLAVSEESGTLAENLSYLAEQLEKQLALKRKVQGAMIYPLFVVIIAVAIGSFLAFGILPKLLVFFESLQVELPLITKVMVWIAEFFAQYGVVIIVGSIILTLLLLLLYRWSKTKPGIEKFLLRLPILGKILRANQLIQFSHNWGVLLHSGVPINQALQITTQSLNNTTYQSFLKILLAKIEKGATAQKAIREFSPNYFPIMVSQMVGVGEKSGSLDEVLLYISDFYEAELDASTKQLATLLEPILLLVIGLGVGFLALAIITPIYELTGAL